MKANNTGVKTPSESDKINELQAQEIIKCAKNPIYFIENYVKIQSSDPTIGSTLFKLYKYQRLIVKQIHNNNEVIILQPRQSGKTTVIVAYLLWLTCFRSDIVAGVASNRMIGAKDIVSRFRYAYEALPSFIKPAVVSYNKFDIEFDNGSKIMSAATTENTFRGFSLSFLYLDEFAFVSPRIADQFWTSILPALSGGGGNSKIVISSTPNGSEGIFPEMWFGAEQERNSFISCRVYEEDVPRPKGFKKQILQKMTIEKYRQEFGCEFISSKGTLIRSTILETMDTKSPIEIIGDLKLFETIKGKRLGIGIDVGTGIGQDSSVMQIFDLDTLEQVGEYQNNDLSISDFTKIIIDVFKFLQMKEASEIYYTVESNSIGQGVITLLENSTHDILDFAYMIHDKKKKKTGMLTTTKTKMRGALKFKDLVEQYKLKINSKQLVSECKFFVKFGSSFKAESGMTDDLVMACIVFCNMLQQISEFDESVYDQIVNLNEGDFDISRESNGPTPFIF